MGEEKEGEEKGKKEEKGGEGEGIERWTDEKQKQQAELGSHSQS